jgi:hypothetical protein
MGQPLGLESKVSETRVGYCLALASKAAASWMAVGLGVGPVVEVCENAGLTNE